MFGTFFLDLIKVDTNRLSCLTYDFIQISERKWVKKTTHKLLLCCPDLILSQYFWKADTNITFLQKDTEVRMDKYPNQGHTAKKWIIVLSDYKLLLWPFFATSFSYFSLNIYCPFTMYQALSQKWVTKVPGSPKSKAVLLV